MTTSRVNVILQASFAGQGEFVRMGRSLRHLSHETSAAGRVMDRFSRTTTGSLRAMAGFLSRQVGNVFRSFFFGVRIYAIAAGAAVSGFVGTSIRAFMDFDKKLRQTTSLIASSQVNAPDAKGSLRKRLQDSRRVAEQEYKAYSKAILRMAVPLSRSPSELASGLTEVVSAGFSGRGPKVRRQSMSILSAAGMGAAAGGGQAAEGTRVLINAVNALGIKPGGQKGGVGIYQNGEGSPMRLMDRFMQTINYGVGIYFKDLAATAGNALGPIGSAMGGGGRGGRKGIRNLNELLASVVVGSQAGLTSSKSTIGFTQILNKLVNPTSQGADVLKSLGLKGGASMLSKGLLSPGGALEQLQNAMFKKGLNPNQQAEAIGTIFKDVRPQRLVTTLYSAGMKNVQSVIKLIENSRGATKAAFGEYQQSLQGITDKFKALFDVVKIGVGKMLAPYVVSALQKFSGILDKITGGTKGMDLMTAFDIAKLKNPSLSAKDFAATVPRKDRETFMRAYEFENAGFAANAKTLISQGLNAVRAWFSSPQTQEMLKNAFYRALDATFSLLGRAAGQAGNVYRFGLTLGVQIAKGIVTGLKDMLSSSGGITGILGGSGGMGLTSGMGLPEKILGGLLGLGVTAGFQQRYAAGNTRMSRIGRGGGAALGAMFAGAPPALLPLIAALGLFQPGPFDPGRGYINRLRGKGGPSAATIAARKALNRQTGGTAFPGELSTTDRLLAAQLGIDASAYERPQPGRDRTRRRAELMRAFGIPFGGAGARFQRRFVGGLDRYIASEGGQLNQYATGVQLAAGRGKAKPLTEEERAAARSRQYESRAGSSLRKFLALVDSVGTVSTLGYRGVNGKFMSQQRAQQIRDMRAPQQTANGRFMGYHPATGQYGFISKAEYDRQVAERRAATEPVRTGTRRVAPVPQDLSRRAALARIALKPFSALESVVNNTASGGRATSVYAARLLRFGLRGFAGKVTGGLSAAAIPAIMAAPDIINGNRSQRIAGIAQVGGAAVGGVAGAALTGGNPLGAMIGATAGSVIAGSLVDLFQKQERDRQARERQDTARRFEERSKRDAAAYGYGTAVSLYTKTGKLKQGAAMSRAMVARSIAAARRPAYMEAAVSTLLGHDVKLQGSRGDQASIGMLYNNMMGAKTKRAAEAAYGKILDLLQATGSDPGFAALVDSDYKAKVGRFNVLAARKRAARARRKLLRQLKEHPIVMQPGSAGNLTNTGLSISQIPTVMQMMDTVGAVPTVRVQTGTKTMYEGPNGERISTGRFIKGGAVGYKPVQVPTYANMPVSVTHGLVYGYGMPQTNAAAFSAGSFGMGAALAGSPIGNLFDVAAPFKQGGTKEITAAFTSAGEAGPRSFQQAFEATTLRANKNVKASVASIRSAVIAEAERQFGVKIRAYNPTSGPGASGLGSSLTVNATSAEGFGGGKSRGKKGTNGVQLSGRGGSAQDPGSLGGLFNRLGAGSAEYLAKKVTRSLLREKILTPKGPVGKAARGLGWLNAQVGKPYIWGGGHPAALGLDGYDCSGLVSSAMLAMGYPMSGTTRDLIYKINPKMVGPVMLGFNRKNNPSHMGISVFGNWFEAKGRGTPILGPGQARSNWPVVGAPMFHTGGVYRAPRPGGEGLALLRDGERVVPTATPRTAGNSSGGDITINIAHAEVRSDQDIKRVAAELHSMLATRRANSGKRY